MSTPTKRKAINNVTIAVKKEKTSFEIAVVEKQAMPIVTKVEALRIQDSKSLEVSVEYLSKMNKFKDMVKQEKERITKPLQEAIAVERGRWKPVEDAITGAIEGLRSKMGAYQMEIGKEAERKMNEAAEQVANGEVEIGSEVGLTEVSARVEAKSGTVTFMDVECFEVEDVGKLPVSFIVANEVAIRAAMKTGTKLAGVRYWMEKRPVNRR